jgi:hypothetical protein
MKDGFLIKKTQDQAKNISIIYNQLKFIDSRMQAFEKLLENRWDILKAIWNPKGFKKDVDELQIFLLRKHDQNVKEAMQKAQDEANKPKLTIVGSNGFKGVGMAFLLVLTLLTGCISSREYKDMRVKMYNEGYEAANFDCVNLQLKIKNYIQTLKDRLQKFNQIDSEGNLR